MAEWVRKYGGVLVAAALAASTLALFVAKAVASAEVEPVKRDVAVLQKGATETEKRVDRMADQIDDIWRWLREERQHQ
jgi:acyl-CoA thioesterase